MSRLVEGRDYGQYSPPIIVSAEKAHREGVIRYLDQDQDGHERGSVIFQHPQKGTLFVPPRRQFPQITETFDDLTGAISSHSNSPRDANGKTLYEWFQGESDHYDALASRTYKEGGWEPDYGNYVYYDREQELYLMAPQDVHRVGLITSPAKLHTDPVGKLTWSEIRGRLDNYVTGIVGASVGGNILEGVMRTVRPLRAKIADPDWPELTNLSRLNRGNVRQLTASRGDRRDLRNPYSATRPNKAAVQAYDQLLVDPYAQFDVYTEGLNPHNADEFLLGNTQGEPRLNLLIEEVDDFEMKIMLKELCRKFGIALLTIGDFGHRAHVQFKDFARYPNLKLGYGIDDAELYDRLDRAQTSGKREDFFRFVDGACGPEYSADEFAVWERNEGEQPTSSTPQLGTPALAAGAKGGEIAAMHALGHEISELTIIDLKQDRTINFSPRAK